MKWLPGRIGLLVLAMLLSGSGRAVLGQKIYLLAAGDAKDPTLGPSVQTDLEGIRLAFWMQIPEDQFVPYNDFDSLWTGPPLDGADDMKAVILEALDGCPARADDTIVFYWSGHGQYDSGGHYLAMPLPNRQPLYRRELIARLQKKLPRLAVVISDACNTHFDSRRLTPPMAPSMRPPERISPLFEALFLKHRGLVDINASSEGEKAIGLDACGGFFTASLTGIAVPAPSESGEPTWRGIQVEVTIPSRRRRTVEIPPGFFLKYSEEPKNWSDLVTHVNQTVQDHWNRLTSQTVQAWSLPVPVAAGRNGRLPPVLSLTRGDVILSVNGNPVDNAEGCIRAVRLSSKTMTFTVRDSRDGTVWRMQTQLRTSTPRFGIEVENAPGGGAVVTDVTAGMPCTRNTVLDRLSKPRGQ